MNCKKIKVFFVFLLPLFELIRTSKKLKEKEEKVDKENYFEYVGNYADLTLDQLDNMQKDFFEYKNSFEDKAKISSVGVSIAISIAIGLLAVLGNFFSNHAVIDWVALIIIVSAIFSLFNMLMAGHFSLKMMGELNVVSKLAPSELTLKNDEKKKKIAQCIEYNCIYNVRRNNYLYASYKSLIISTISLMVVFLIVSLPIHRKKDDVDIVNMCNELKTHNTNLLAIDKSLRNINDSISALETNSIELIEKSLNRFGGDDSDEASLSRARQQAGKR